MSLVVISQIPVVSVSGVSLGGGVAIINSKPVS